METLLAKLPITAENLSAKGEIRRLYKARRSALPPERRTEAALALAHTLGSLLVPYEKVLSFTSFGSEIDTSLLNQLLQERGQLVLPEESADVSIVLVPGLAFDSRYHRLGYGRGWYDQRLAALAVPMLGIGFREQWTETLPSEPHDIPLTALHLF